MPKWLHEKIEKEGRKKGLSGDRLKAYVYSVLKRMKKGGGSMRKNETPLAAAVRNSNAKR